MSIHSDRCSCRITSSRVLLPLSMSATSSSVKENDSYSLVTKPKYWTKVVFVTRPSMSITLVPCRGKHAEMLPPFGLRTNMQSAEGSELAEILPSSSNWNGPLVLEGRINVMLLAGLPSNLITKRGVEKKPILTKATQIMSNGIAMTIRKGVIFFVLFIGSCTSKSDLQHRFKDKAEYSRKACPKDHTNNETDSGETDKTHDRFRHADQQHAKHR